MLTTEMVPYMTDDSVMNHKLAFTPVIDKGSLVLITGVSGFLASHTANQFLDSGYRVRGTVRSREKAQWLFDLFDEKYGKGRFDVVIVPDMEVDDAFDEAVDGVDAICHMASVVTFSDRPEEVIPATVKGAVNILTAARKEPNIRSLVYTSSSTAATMPSPNRFTQVNKESWNDTSVNVAWGPCPDAYNVYGASKTEAEKALWKAVEETCLSFQVAAVLPNANFGPIIRPGGEDSASTGSNVVKVWKGDRSVLKKPPQWFVDVRDTARLHVAALIDPSCNWQRLFAFAAPYNWNDVLRILRKQNPDHEFPEEVEGMGRDLCQIPNHDAEALLRKHFGKGFTSLEESIEANTRTLRCCPV